MMTTNEDIIKKFDYYKNIQYTGIAIRLDRLLKRELPEITQGIIERALRKKLVKVNAKNVIASYRVNNNDIVQIDKKLYEKFVLLKIDKSFSPLVVKLAEKILSEYLLYDHSEFIAINKPDKLPTQGGSKISLSLDDALSYLNSKGNNYKLVHRIDKDTSGILLIAKGYDAATRLTKAFADKIIEKHYLAVVKGTLPASSGKIDSMVKKLGSDVEAKNAITYYKLLKELKNNMSLVEFNPVTGRMHQLRIHAQHINCPIIGDKKYGDHDTKDYHLFLHAYLIKLPKELFKKEIEVIAPLPDYFKKIIK